MRIILASKSPRRKELLGMITKDFEIIVSDADEHVEENVVASEKVKMIASKKANAVLSMVDGDVLIIGCDTIVVVDNEILGKPCDEDNAKLMIRKLDNRWHEVMSGLSIIVRKDGNINEYTDVDITNVHVKHLDDDEIDAWIDTKNAMDKAGAYAIQDEFAKHIDKIDGNFQSVMGLPVSKLYDIIKKYI